MTLSTLAYQDIPLVSSGKFPYKRCTASLRMDDHITFRCTQPARNSLHFKDAGIITHTAAFSDKPNSLGYIKDAVAAVYWITK